MSVRLAVLLLLCATVCENCRRRRTTVIYTTNRSPVLSGCPSSPIDVTAPRGSTTGTATWNKPTASDPEGHGAPTVDRISGQDPGTTFREGTTQIGYRARDVGGASSYCWFQVSVTVVRCYPRPRYITNGVYTCSGREENLYGSVCTYSCNYGYEIPSGSTSAMTCQQDGTWDATVPTCNPVSCGDPGSITSGSYSCPDGHTFSKMCFVMCAPGFRQPSGMPFVRCLQSRQWTSAADCVDAEAPKFPSGCPVNMNVFAGPLEQPVAVTWPDPLVIDSSNYTLYSSVTKGSALSTGFHVIRLTATDAMGLSASCNFVVVVTVRKCDYPYPPVNGRLSHCTRGYVEGSACTVVCNSGYTLQGNATLTCQASETWDNAMPSCTAVACGSLPSVQFGSFVSSSSQGPAEYTLNCDPTFDLVGDQYVRCQTNGSWSQPGRCVDNQGPTFPQGCTGNVEVFAASLGQPTLVDWNPPATLDNSGQNVTLVSSAAPGSAFAPGVTPVSYTATDPLGNTGACSFTVTVTTLTCPSLTQNATSTTFLRYSCPDKNVLGATCFPSCTQGFPLQGADRVTCQSDNSTFPPAMAWVWDAASSRPECIQSNCPNLTAPQNGALACYQGNFAKECGMNCQADWDVPAITDGKATCPNNLGTWTPSALPNCVVRVRPGHVQLLSDLYYYTGSCTSSTQEIQQNFIDLMNNSTWSNACASTASCVAQNVQVTCGSSTAGKKKREAEETGDIEKRSTTHHVRVSRAAEETGDREKRSTSHHVRVSTAAEETGDREKRSTSHHVRVSTAAEETGDREKRSTSHHVRVSTAAEETGDREKRSTSHHVRVSTAAEETGDREKRSTSHYVRVSFELLLPYLEGSSSPEDYYQQTMATMGTIYSTLNDEVTNGHFNMASMPTLAVDTYGFSYFALDAECPPGTSFTYTASTTRVSCVGCSKGNFLASGAASCQQCPVGSYTPLDDATACTPCPAGYSTATTASTNSSDCQEMCRAGQFSDDGFVPCQPCPPGQYQSRERGVTCDLCPASTWTNGSATGLHQCVPADAHLSNGTSLNAYAPPSLSTLTVTYFVHLSDIATVNATFTFADSSLDPISVFLCSQNSTCTNVPANSATSVFRVVPAQVWSRFQLTHDPSAGNSSVSLNHVTIFTNTLPAFASLPALHLSATAMEGLAKISGLFGVKDAASAALPGVSGADCNGNASSNLLAWSLPATAIHSSSDCDAVDACLSSPCSSHGQCVDLRDGYLCQCRDGWSGPTCIVPPDACYLHQCQNAATCQPQGASSNYTCLCAQGFSGQRCELVKVNGAFGEYGPWSNCSATCEGEQHRTRLCSNPAPLNGGDTCTGNSSQTQSCGDPHCPVDGGWSPWAPWSTCSESCAGGDRIRQRQCDSPAPQHGGEQCPEGAEETEACNTGDCPVDGGLTEWSEWSTCSVSCGTGSRSRDRLCESPAPTNGGAPCVGSTNETDVCGQTKCPECSILRRTASILIRCDVTPDPVTCNITCAPGYDSSTPFPQYQCGSSTGHLWNNQLTATSPVILPVCSVPYSHQSAELTQTVPLQSGCNVDRTAVVAGVTQNLQQLPCAGHGCQGTVTTMCVDAAGTGVGRRRRSSSGTLNVVLTASVDFGPATLLNGSDPVALQNYQNLYHLVNTSVDLLVQNETSSLFAVVINGIVILPDVPSANYSITLTCPEGNTHLPFTCVPCSPGTKEESGQCEPCPVGQYQDTPGSTSCKACPAGLAYDLPGASDIRQCVFPFASSPPSYIASWSSEDDLPVGLIVGGVLAGVFALMIVAGVVLVVVFKKNPPPLWNSYARPMSAKVHPSRPVTAMSVFASFDDDLAKSPLPPVDHAPKGAWLKS